MTPGSALGLDFGEARIGVAFSPAGTRAVVPLDYVPAHPRSRAIRLLRKLVEERGVSYIYLGLPKHLNGTEGASAAKVRQFGNMLAAKLPDVRVALLDERRSTLEAQGKLRDAGIPARDQRVFVDSTAALVILEQALESQVGTGLPAGEVVSTPDTERSVDE